MSRSFTICCTRVATIDQHFVLCRALEKAASRAHSRNLTCEKYIEEYLLQPMGMAESGFNYTDDVRARMAVGVNQFEGAFAKRSGELRIAGALRATLHTYP